MPGLLDFFSPDDPNKQQGLLAAAAAMLQASGPSRMPTSFGQVLGQGLGGYQQGYQGAQNRDLQMEAAKQEAQLRGLKIQDAESDVANQQKMRERQNRIAQRLMGAQGPAASPDAQQAPMASAMPGTGPMSPKTGGPDWLQPYQQQSASQMPAAQPAPAAPRANQTDAYVERLLSTAHVYASEGDIDTANKLYEQASKLRPKYSTDFRTAMGADGKMHNYQLADDGTQRDTGLGVAPNVTEVDLGGSKQFVDKNSVTPGQIFNKTATPGEQISARQAAARLQFDKSQANGSDDTASFSAQAIDNAAARYNVDGSLPPMGMGKAAAAGRTKILNRAAELKADIDPEQQRRDQLNNKGDIAARNNAVRSFGVGKDGQAVQSANTALNHLATIRELAEAQKSGNIQAFNKAARALGAQLGQSAPTNLNSALIMVAPEVSKAVVGAGGTGHERDQALQALNPNGSPDQIIGGTQTMQELFGGRLTEAKRTYERTTMRKDFDTAMLSPAAQAVLSRAQQHGSGGAASASASGGQLKSALKGQVMDGYRFKGGNPADPSAWEKL